MKKALSLLLAVVMLLSVMTAALPLESGALTWYEYWHGSNQPIINENVKYEYYDGHSRYEDGILYFSRPYGYPAGKKDEAKDTKEVHVRIEFSGNKALEGSYYHTFEWVKTPYERDNPLNVKTIMSSQYWPSGIYTFEILDPWTQDYWKGDDTSWYRTHIFATRRLYGSFVYESPYEKLENPSYLRWEGEVAKWEPVPHATKYYVDLFNETNNVLRSVETSDTQWDFRDSSLKKISDGWYFKVIAKSSGPYTQSIPSLSPPKKSYTLTFDKNGGEGSSSVTVSNISGNYVLPTGSKGFIAPYESEFIGWSLDKNGSQMVSSVNMDANKTVYAIWKKVGGKIGSNVSYNLNVDTGELTIFGSGDMYFYAQGYPNPSPFYNNSNVKSVRISAGVTSIGDYMFYGCSNLKYVYLENALDLTKIGHGAFGNCSSLERMIYPGGLSKAISYIDSNVFENCTSLKEFRIPEGVSFVGANAFYNCSALKYVTIPKVMTSIGENVFKGCVALQDIFYSGSQEDWNKIDKSNNAALLSYATLHPYTAWGIPVGDNALYIADVFGQSGRITGTGSTYNYSEELCSPIEEMQIDEITIEDGITKIGNYLFANCNNVSKVNIGNSVNQIGEYAFYDCDGLESIEIPDSVTEIKKSAFDQCDNLKSITLGSGLSSIAQYAFYTCPQLEKLYYNGTRGQFNSIYISAYNYSLPGKVYSIGGPCGDSATYRFEPDSATLTISGTGKMTNYALGDSSTEPPWHNYNDEIDAVVIEEGITTVGTCAFIDSGIRSVSIPNTVTKLMSSCFMECCNLEIAFIPDSVTEIGSSAFFKDTALTNVFLSENITEIPNFFVGDCTALKQLYMAEGIKTIGVFAFRNCTSLQAINIPDSVTSIDEYSFDGASDTLIVYASCGHPLVESIIAGTNRTWEKQHGSTSTKKLNKKAATCTAKGSYDEVTTCSVCGKDVVKKTVSVAAKGHNFSKNTKVVKPTSVKAGYNDQKCSVCGAKRRVITAPTGKVKTLKCKKRTSNAETMTWSAVKGAQGYQIQISTKDGKAWDKIYNAKTKTSYTIKSLAAGGYYKFRIRIYAKGVDGKWSFGAWTKAVTSPTLPSGTSITKLSGASKSFSAQWKQNKNVNGYQLQYSLNSNFSGAKTVTIKGNGTLKTTVNKLNAKKVYYVRIRTYKSIEKVNYFSAWSKSVKVKTK